MISRAGRHLHRSDGGCGARSGLEGWEGCSSASSLDISASLAGGENCDIGLGTWGNGDDFRAVDEVTRVVAEDSKLGHDGLELGDHEALVV